MSRKSWDEYFMDIAMLVGTRSTCLRRQVGAVLVKDNIIISTGYNGAPSGLPHCIDVGCERERLSIPSGERHELCVAVHAEQNAIIQAANKGLLIKGATVYTTTYPCVICAKMLINAGICRVVYSDKYVDELSERLLECAGVELYRLGV